MREFRHREGTLPHGRIVSSQCSSNRMLMGKLMKQGAVVLLRNIETAKMFVNNAVNNRCLISMFW